jgi:hypothetical protein
VNHLVAPIGDGHTSARTASVIPNRTPARSMRRARNQSPGRVRSDAQARAVARNRGDGHQRTRLLPGSLVFGLCAKSVQTPGVKSFRLPVPTSPSLQRGRVARVAVMRRDANRQALAAERSSATLSATLV